MAPITLAQQVKETQKDIGVIKTEVAGLSTMLHEVHTALMGSGMTKDGGMIQRLNDAEKELVEVKGLLDKIEKKNIKADLYLKIIWGLCGGLVSAIGITIIKHLLG